MVSQVRTASALSGDVVIAAGALKALNLAFRKVEIRLGYRQISLRTRNAYIISVRISSENLDKAFKHLFFYLQHKVYCKR